MNDSELIFSSDFESFHDVWNYILSTSDKKALVSKIRGEENTVIISLLPQLSLCELTLGTQVELYKAYRETHKEAYENNI